MLISLAATYTTFFLLVFCGFYRAAWSCTSHKKRKLLGCGIHRNLLKLIENANDWRLAKRTNEIWEFKSERIQLRREVIFLYPSASQDESPKHVATLIRWFGFSCSLQQSGILRIRHLDRRDRFVGDSFSESGAKVNCVMFRACVPYASHTRASVPVTVP